MERLTDAYLQRVRKTGLRGVGGRGLRGKFLYRAAACLNYFSKVDPEIVASLERSLKRYERIREAAGVDSRLLEEPSYLLEGPLAPTQIVVETGVGMFPAAFRYLTGAVPFYLTRYLADRFATRSRYLLSLSLWHVLIAAVAFPLIWGVEIAVVWSLASFTTALIFSALLIPLGLFARFYIRRSRKLTVHIGGRVASWVKMDAVLRVREARSEMVDLMDTIRSRYLEEVFAPATKYHGPNVPSRNS